MNDKNTAGVDLDKLPRLYRFDRYQGACKLAEGIGVHATSMADAIEKARELARKERMPVDGIDLQFVSNEPCAAARRCSICEAYEDARRAEPSVTAATNERALFEAALRAEHGDDLTQEDVDACWSELPGYMWRRSRAALASPAVSQQAAPESPTDKIWKAEVARLERELVVAKRGNEMLLAENDRLASAPAVSRKDGAAVEVQLAILSLPITRDFDGRAMLDRASVECLLMGWPLVATPTATTASASIDTAEFRKLSYAYAEALFKGTVPQTSVAWGALVEHIDGRAQAPSRDAAPQIKTWQERSVGPDGLGLYPDAFACMQAEITDLRAALARAPLPAQGDAKPVGVVGTMPGSSGFTMACFKAADVPVGTKLYLAAPAQAGDARYERAGWFLYEGIEWVATSSDDPRATILYRKSDAENAAMSASQGKKGGAA